jgi:hypothetical protein
MVPSLDFADYLVERQHPIMNISPFGKGILIGVSQAFYNRGNPRSTYLCKDSLVPRVSYRGNLYYLTPLISIDNTI